MIGSEAADIDASSGTSDFRIVAIAQAMQVISLPDNSEIVRRDCAAIASRKGASLYAKGDTDQAVLLRCCCCNAEMLRIAEAAIESLRGAWTNLNAD